MFISYDDCLLYFSSLNSLSYLLHRVRYRAPEILLGDKKYSSAIDLWSFGCVFGELANGGVPVFVGDSEIGTIFQIFKTIGES